MFDFDEVIDRRGTHSSKWDTIEQGFGVSPDDGLAMWVADMDFRAPPAVNEALHELATHGVHGYYGDDASYTAAIAGWMKRRHDWHVEPEWIATTHGIVAGLAVCLQAFSEPGEGVVLFTPVYHAFAKIIKANGGGSTNARSSSKRAVSRWISTPLPRRSRGRRRSSSSVRRTIPAVGSGRSRSNGRWRISAPSMVSCSSPTRSTMISSCPVASTS